jgi:hypothetical protein
MVLEGTQMLCTVLSQYHIKTPYRPTHSKHPCTLWAGRSLSNWKWLLRLTLQLNQEFRYRYRKEVDHKSALVAQNLPFPPIPDIGLTELVQAMPDKYKVTGDSVQAYRNYYIDEKSSFATWTRRRPPKWFMQATKNITTAPAL